MVSKVAVLFLQSHQHHVRVRISPHPSQQLLLSVFLNIAILKGVKWHLAVDLICTFLTISGLGTFSCAY